ncbi:IS200/IS605 family transposase [Bacillus cereus]
MVNYKTGSHSVYEMKYHFVWVTKYRYHILTGEIAHRVEKSYGSVVLTRDITIIKGSVGKDHINLLLSCPPTIAPSKIIQYLKGRSSRLLQQEYSQLKRDIGVNILWARGYFCATVGAVNEETIRKYIEGQQGEHDDVFDVKE